MQGVIGVYSKEDACTKSLYLLYGVQHRGQESSGITATSDNSIRTWKGRGLVSNVFDERFRSFIHPNDYVIVGCASGENADYTYPPLETASNERYSFSLVIDGYIPRRTGANEEAINESILSHLNNGLDFEHSLQETMKNHRDAYYCLVAAVWDRYERRSFLTVARDEHGLRPLYFAHNESSYYVASESAPMDVLENMGEHFEERRDITPGSILVIDSNGARTTQVLEPKRAHCVFEWVYFGRPDSVIEGKTVHSVRKLLGHALVETHDLVKEYGVDHSNREDLVVIPVPDSGRSVCTGVAEALGVTADEGVIKNSYMGRTYIIDDPAFRKVASDLKHNIIKETVNEKKVIITDDSIVRGTVSESVAKNLLKAGAKEVEFLVSYAPIFYPCFSDPTDKPLAARNLQDYALEEIGNLIAEGLPSINKVRYNSEQKIIEAVGLPMNNICTYCISGRNPLKQS
jgi:amidophosphoribosyltransferase